MYHKNVHNGHKRCKARASTLVRLMPFVPREKTHRHTRSRCLHNGKRCTKRYDQQAAGTINAIRQAKGKCVVLVRHAKTSPTPTIGQDAPRIVILPRACVRACVRVRGSARACAQPWCSNQSPAGARDAWAGGLTQQTCTPARFQK